MSEVGRTVRKSKRDNKGVPPRRLGFCDEDMSLSRTPPQAFIDRNLTMENNTVFGTPAEQAVNAAANSAATAANSAATGNSGTEAENNDVAADVDRATTGNATSSHNTGNGIEQVTLEFNKKMTDIQNEFQRQIHELSRIFADNSRQIQSSVQTLQQEMVRMAPRGNIATPTVSTQNIVPTSELLHIANPPRPTESEVSVNSQRVLYTKIVNLPPFGGDPLDWPMFERSFIDTTQEFGYSNTRNIIRLREALHGASKVAVAALLPYPDSVQEIMNTLRENFGRPDQIINCQVMEIRKIAPIPSGNISLIIPFANKVKNMTAFVRYAKAEQRLCDVTLLGELVSKIPIEEQMKWAEYKEGLSGYANIDNFSNFLSIIAKRANILADSMPRAAMQAASSVQRHKMYETGPEKGAKKRVLLVNAQEGCLVCNDNCGKMSSCPIFNKMPINERWSKVKALRVCYSCLGKGHSIAKCYSKKKCLVNGCDKLHNRLLHIEASNNTASNSSANSQAVQPNQIARSYRIEATTDSSEVLFQILPVVVSSGTKSVETYAFIDQGASHSMVERDLADELGLTGPSDTLHLHWLGNVTSTNATKRVTLNIRGHGEQYDTFKIANLHTVHDMNLPKQSFNLAKYGDVGISRELLNLRYVNAQPRLLIGLDNAKLFRALERPFELVENGLIAMKTPLGWVVYGNYNEMQVSVKNHLLLARKGNKIEELENLVQAYFANESFGISPKCAPLLSEEDKRAMALMEATSMRKNDRFEVGLLWARDSFAFPDSFGMAKKRLEGIERKMAMDEEFANQYNEKIDSYVEKGYVRKLSEYEVGCKTEKTFYLPHFAVRNANKKGLRIVFDAAAEVEGMSLNKTLLCGPVLNQSLLSILLKFRQSPIAVCGDIREMFLQVAVREEDQQAQRFLWRRGDSSRPIDTYVMTRMLFGASCSPTLAQYVKNMNAEAFKEQSPRAVQGIIERHYVDDYVDCFESEREAIEVVKDVVKIHKAGGFELANLVSNSENVARDINASNDSFKEASMIDVSRDNTERILGMYWSTSTDEFMFVFKFQRIPPEILRQSRKPTKREVLSLVMSMFDPFGILANFLISAKLLLQQLWTRGVQWDEMIPDDIYSKWIAWLEEMPKVKEVRLPRCYYHRFTSSQVELHIFADASESALAVVAYWRIVDDKDIFVRFIAGKAKCAPIKYQSIPRLELQAAVMAARLKETIVNEHSVKPKKVYFWSDSTTVIAWIRSSTRRYKQFVANRISEILDCSDVEQRRWLPSEENVADEGTRAKFSASYDPNGRWLTGPPFLLKAQSHWPQQPKNNLQTAESALELKAEHRILAAVSVRPNIIDFKRFSKLSRLKRCMAWVLRFIENCSKARKKLEVTKSGLTTDEEAAAEIVLCRIAQEEAYPVELHQLRNKRLLNKGSPLITLNPNLDDEGVLRLSGRIENAPFVPTSAKRLIILPKNHDLTKLVVKWYHNKWRHINVNLIVNEIRQKFWIPSLRVLVKSVGSNCNLCRVRKALPVQPMMAPLPVDRLTAYVRPFTYSGVDFFGPLLVTIRRRKEKRWVALFTCLTTRAIHLELATNLSSDALLLCIRNFINRRGVPIQIRSDNGTNFVGLTKELRGVDDFIDHGAISDSLTPLGIRWKFNCPSNPSEGGIWERLVQSVKKALYIMLKECAPQVDTLNSLLIEAENIVNSRPLTHLPVTPDDPEPITPNHFLLNSVNSTQTPMPVDKKLLCLRKQWRISQTLKNGFWKQWMREYLPELTRRSKWCQPTRSINVGDLVLTCETELPRSQWKRGRITKLYYGSDGIARSADVQTSTTLLKRPVSKLALLDVVDTL